MFLHGGLVAARAAHAHASMDSIRLLRDKKKAVKLNEMAVWLLPVEKTNRESSAVIEQLKREFPTVTITAAKEIGALTALLEQAVEEVRDLEKGRKATTWERGKLRELREGVQYEWDKLLAKLQSTRR